MLNKLNYHEKTLHVLLLLIAIEVYTQVLYSYATQSSGFQIVTGASYKVVKNEQSNGFTTQVGAPQLPVFIKKLVILAGSKNVKSILAPKLASLNKKPCKSVDYRVLSGVGGIRTLVQTSNT